MLLTALPAATAHGTAADDHRPSSLPKTTPSSRPRDDDPHRLRPALLHATARRPDTTWGLPARRRPCGRTSGTHRRSPTAIGSRGTRHDDRQRQSAPPPPEVKSTPSGIRTNLRRVPSLAPSQLVYNADNILTFRITPCGDDDSSATLVGTRAHSRHAAESPQLLLAVGSRRLL